jgi:RNA polymerase sigma-70 factor (ECF subfamily)
LEEKFISLIQNHEGIIHKVIGLYVDNDEDRKDMYQEMLLQAWKSYVNFREDSTFSTWLYKVCLNTALTYRKKEDTRKKINLEAAASQSEATMSTSSEQHEILYLIIKQLSEVDRMLMTLHLDAYKNQEIAEITGMSTNHVNVKIHRLKAKIIDQLKKASDGHI